MTVNLRDMLLSGDARAQGWASIYIWLAPVSHGGGERTRAALWRWMVASDFMQWVGEALADERT